MILHLVITLLSALVTVALTPLVKRLAFAVEAVDHPGGRRRVHERRVPRLGGLAIFFPVMLALVAGLWIIPEGGGDLKGRELIGLLVSSACVFLLGVYDDMRGANAPVKLTVQIAAAGLLYFAGVRISEVWTPFGWMANLGVFAFPFTLLWLVGLTNGMNLLDGVDGLAAGVAALVSLAILFISLGMGNIQLSLMAAALVGSLLGFLVFNFYPAKIFLGDCGAMFLGFFLAAISVLGNQKSASAIAMGVPIIALGIPIFDTSLAVIRRVLRGKPPFQADRDHVHHRLLALGLSQPQVAIILYIASAFLSVMALLMARANQAVAALIVLCLILAVIAAMHRLKAGELREILRFFQFGERRRRPPRYRAMLVRNTLPLLERCDSVAALRALLEEVRKDLGFERLQVSFKAEAAPAILNGALEFEVGDSSPVRKPDLVRGNGVPSWTGRTEILCEERGKEDGELGAAQTSVRMRVLGEVVATKPAWKRRRASENDDELLQFLADGLAKWIATQRVAQEQPTFPPATQPTLATRLLNGLRNGRPPHRS